MEENLKNKQSYPPQNTQNEEIDLGRLFIVIGNGFKKFFNAIGSVFKAIYKLVVLFLVHLFRRFWWYAGAIVTGLVLGYFLEKNIKDTYAANLYISVNYDSAKQVYEVVKELNQLADKDQDSVQLSERLEIPVKDAASIKAFLVEPVYDEQTLIAKFATYKQSLDSVAASEAIYEDYKEALDFYSFDEHKIQVESTDKDVYEKLRDNLVKEFVSNEYVVELRETAIKNIDSHVVAINRELVNLESLQNAYLRVRTNMSEKEGGLSSGTNLMIGGSGSSNEASLFVDETKLFDKREKLQAQKRALLEQKVKAEDIINVISDFPVSGYDIKGWKGKEIIVTPIVLVGLLLFGFSLWDLSKFLKREQEKLSRK